MSNNKYSSVEWLSNQSYELFEQYSEGNFDRITLNKLMLKTTEQAKEMHKQESINLTKHWYNQWEQGKGMIISEYYDQEFNNK